MNPRFTVEYRPLYFLSALGMGGLSVSFFVYLLFLVPHRGEPIPNFDHIAAALASGTVLTRGLLIAALAFIAYFAFRHYQFLIANIAAYRRFTRSPDFETFRRSNAEVSLMAIPLTLAMSVNVTFIVAAVAIPGLWGLKEFLFPAALLAMTAIGAYSLVLFGRYLTRIFVHKGFDIEDTNHFSQVLPSFAFAMIATGFSSAAAMSDTRLYAVLGLIGSFLFVTAALAWAVVKLPVSFAGMLRHGMSVEAGPTLWLAIPILTLFGITLIRDTSGIAHTILHAQVPPILWFVAFSFVISAQLIVALFGYGIMHRQDYFATFVSGQRRSIASYGLICPGVAFSVMFLFFLHWGLVEPGIVARDTPLHYGLLLVSAAVQVITIRTLVRLNRKLVSGRPVRATTVDVVDEADETPTVSAQAPSRATVTA